jgi:hypothetical protein
MNSSDLAFDRGEAAVELLDCIVEIRFRDHMILDEIDGLKELCVFAGKYTMALVGARVRRRLILHLTEIGKRGRGEALRDHADWMRRASRMLDEDGRAGRAVER